MFLIVRPFWAQTLNYQSVEVILASIKPQRCSQPDYPLSKIVQLPFFLLGGTMRAIWRICSLLWLARWQRHSGDLGIMCMWQDIWDRSHEAVLFSLGTNGTFFLFPESKTNLFPKLVTLPWWQLAIMLVKWALANHIRADVWLQNQPAEYSLAGLLFLLSTSEVTGLIWCDVADTALRAARGPCHWLIQAQETWWGLALGVYPCRRLS